MTSSSHHVDQLQGRYDLLETIGRGSQGTTRLARDLDTGERVVAKELKLDRTETWRAIELFERERNTLAALDHPNIPEYLDGFQLDGREGPRFFLVCEYIEGRSLDARIDDGESMDESAIRSMLADILEVLTYLHGREPPVLHRDVKPANVLERPDDTYVLIDFGTVEAQMDAGLSESTAVGTAGYTAPEQMQGRAEPTSDLYGLGATALTMLSAREDEMSGMATGAHLRDELNLSDDLADLLESMLAPDLEARPESAEAALGRLIRSEPPA